MKNNFYKLRCLASMTALMFIAGCMGGGGAYGNNPTYGLGSATSTALGGGVQGAVLGSIIQSMAGSVLNGQIGSQLAPDDKTFRLQQLGGLMQSGSVNQPRQWVNPKTGNVFVLKPIGQQGYNQQFKQKCINMEETLILRNGKRIPENRRACLNPNTGKWNLVQ